eukprot:6802479-Pyramimonas_sp.AAC.1
MASQTRFANSKPSTPAAAACDSACTEESAMRSSLKDFQSATLKSDSCPSNIFLWHAKMT